MDLFFQPNFDQVSNQGLQGFYDKFDEVHQVQTDSEIAGFTFTTYWN